MNKKSIEILEKIISQGGSCNSATPDECKVCPLGTARFHANGTPMGCIDNLKIKGLSIEEADRRYLEAAASALADLKIEEILREDDGANQ